MTLPLPPLATARYPGEFLLGVARRRPEMLQRIARDCGDVAGFRIGPQLVVLLSHPDDVRDVLVTQGRKFKKGRGLERARALLGEGLLTSEDPLHRRQRRLVQPAFHRQRVAAYGDVMSACAARAAGRWRPGQAIDAAAEMMRLTLAVVGRTLFDADVEGEASEVGDALADVFAAFGLAVVMPFGELLERFPLPAARRFRRARDRLDAIIYRIIRERRASADDRGDLLSMLLAAQDVDGDTDAEAEAEAKPDGAGMSDRQLRDEALTLFIAGHETTAVALAWTWYLLARHPDAEARLHAELDAALPPGAPDAGFGDLPRLPYARMVLAESMRLYPPAWIIGRRALEDVEIGGRLIPRGALVLMSQLLVHRDPRWFPDPDRFDPDRWAPDATTGPRHKLAYFPFGAGTRVCIGEQFAWMEGVILLATIARRWRLRLDPPDQRVEMRPMVTLRPGAIRIRFEARG
ncbi:MAG TPA: cytochrome P450 [Gemmatimonadaceae bacterium]|nr:cytochrome P450 [Gemmatimonadaceae bacterium]